MSLKLSEKQRELESAGTAYAAKYEKLKQAAEVDLNKIKDQAKKSILDLRKKLESRSKSSGNINSTLTKAKHELVKQQNDLKVIRSGVTAQLQQFPNMAKLITDRINQRLAKQAEAMTGVVDNYKREMKERKRLFNLVQELQGNIRVLCRFRPISKSETANGSKNVCKFTGTEEVSLIGEKSKSKSWEFDRVFDMNSTQEQVFAEVKVCKTLLNLSQLEANDTHFLS